jgi:hypothetical protein
MVRQAEVGVIRGGTAHKDAHRLPSHGGRRPARILEGADGARRVTVAASQFGQRQQNPGVVEFLATNAGWSEFLRDMLAAVEKYGALTDNQRRAVRSTQAKVAERDAARGLREGHGDAGAWLAAGREIVAALAAVEGVLP